jgi:tetratricopeptide (TPR) repeat protein
MLDKEARTELRSLSKETADLVARHLVVAGRLLDDDPQQALVHARAARALAGRVGAVREAAGLAAYHAGDWTDALSELRAARRITGRADQLPVMADCERALGRPEKALAYGDDPAVTSLEQGIRVELVIVLAGARRDLAQADAAVLMLQDPAKRTTAKRPWAARLWYAYADALLDAGRAGEAREWFDRVAAVDDAGETDVVDRLLELDGVVLDGFDDEDPPDG